jgi:hypothetical protein
LAFRHGQTPLTVGAALSEASREDRVTWVALEPLTKAEAAELVGERAAAIFTQAGGNPFYLQQLARTGDAAGADAVSWVGASVPAAVASALSAELNALAPTARRMLDVRRSLATRSTRVSPQRWLSCPMRPATARSTTCSPSRL